MDIHKTSNRLPVRLAPLDIPGENYRITLVVVDRSSARLQPVFARAESLPYLLAKPRPASSTLLWIGMVAVGVIAVLAATLLSLRSAENRSVIRMAIPPIQALAPMAAKTLHTPYLAKGAISPTDRTATAGPVTAAKGIELGRVPLSAQAQTFVRVDDLPPAQEAVARALRSGIAEPWSDIGVKGYAVAGPVQLADNRVCRIVAVWAETGSQGGGVTSSRSFCRSAAGGWTRVGVLQPNSNPESTLAPAASPYRREQGSGSLQPTTLPTFAPALETGVQREE